MNSKFIKASLLLISASALFIVGCGPVDANFADNGILNKDDQGMQAAPDEAKGMDADASDEAKGMEANAPDDAKGMQAGRGMRGMRGMRQAPQGMQGPQGEGQEGGCPTGGCPTGGCPTGGCEIAPDADTHNSVQMPDKMVTEPTKVTPTEEQQFATDVRDFHQTTHVGQPHERHHRVNKHRETINRFFPKTVYHPTTRRINTVTRTFSTKNETMPTEEVVEPVVDYGCQTPQPAPVVVRPVIRVPVAVPVYSYFGW